MRFKNYFLGGTGTEVILYECCDTDGGGKQDHVKTCGRGGK
jgi:hypothetical protein